VGGRNRSSRFELSGSVVCVLCLHGFLSTDEIEFGSSSVNLLKCCVLTGASGFLGSFILKELLVQGCRVRALVRSEKKLRNDVERYKVGRIFFGRFVVSQKAKKIDVDWSLVEVFEGDLALRNFGLSDERFSALGKEIDCVIHNGCDVNGLYPYSLLRGANVGGTIEAIRLAAKSRLIFVSSISSLCGPKEGFDDRPLSVKGIEKVHSGYVRHCLFFFFFLCWLLIKNKKGQTKRVSEILVEAAKAKGLRASIVRPGTIGPVSAWNENDTLTKLFFGIEQLKLAPNVDANISVAPVIRMLLKKKKKKLIDFSLVGNRLIGLLDLCLPPNLEPPSMCLAKASLGSRC
jgi:thioester reductase-like protein